MDKVTVRAIAIIATAIVLMMAIPYVDLKIVLVSPSSATPTGATMIVQGGRGFRPIDSLEAACERCLSPTNWCRSYQLDLLRKGSKIRVTLPFSDTLFRLSGASAARWAPLGNAI
jgi:hypothetical protein